MQQNYGKSNRRKIGKDEVRRKKRLTPLENVIWGRTSNNMGDWFLKAQKQNISNNPSRNKTKYETYTKKAFTYRYSNI